MERERKKQKYKIRNGEGFLKEGVREGFIDFWEGFQKKEGKEGKNRKEKKTTKESNGS